jgi:hypothetical protein
MRGSEKGRGKRGEGRRRKREVGRRKKKEQKKDFLILDI